jgi:hypothetical protein
MPAVRRAVCSRRPPPRPGLATGDFGVDAPCGTQKRVLSERRRPSARSFKNRADGTLQVGSPSRPTTLFVRRSGLLGEDRRAVREGGYLFARSREGKRARGTPPFNRTFVNDPSAGSPTDTLLRLLRPLPQIICPTSQPNDHGQADHGTHPYRSLTGTIGRSDGRCVQRAGT